MHIADIIILVILAIPALVGLAYGFLNIIFSLLAWAIAGGIATKTSVYFAPLLAPYIDNDTIRSVAAFAIVFIISLILFSLIAYFIVKLLGRVGLTAADRLLGLVFGFSLGLMIVGILVFLAGFTPLPKELWWQDSIFIGPFEKLAIWSQQYLPEGLVKHHGYELASPIDVVTEELEVNS